MAYTQQTPIGTPDVNLITKTLAGLQPDSALQQYAMLHKNNPYILSLAKSESDRRKALRTAAQGQNAGQMPTVVDQNIAGMAPTPMVAQTQLPENQGIAQIPTPNMQRMADGGIAGYEDDEEGMATGGMGGMFNFAQQSEPVVRMAEGGIPRFNGTSSQFVQDIIGLPQAFDDWKQRAREEDERKAKIDRRMAQKKQEMLDARSKTSLSNYLFGSPQSEAEGLAEYDKATTPEKAAPIKVTPTYSPADYSAMDRRIMSGSSLPNIPSINPPPAVKAAPAPGPKPAAPGPKPAAPAADKASEGLEALTSRFTRESDLGQGALRNQRVGLASILEKEATDEAAAVKKRVKDEGDVFAGKEARLAEREKGLTGMKDENLGLALLQAGAAMMSTPGNLGQAIGIGVQVGSKSYITGMDKINTAKEKFAEARDRMEDLRLNRKDMNNKEIRDADRAIRNSRIQGQQLMLDGATNDLKISTDNQRAIFTTAADAIQTDKKLTSAENIAATGERGANARAGMLPGEARAAMLLGTGSTDAERLTSGMTKYKELTGDKQGTQLLKLFLEENGRREKNLEKPLTLDQFRRTAAAFYAPPSAVDTSKPDRQ